MLRQIARGVVWNPFPVRHAGPQYNVFWLEIEESVGRPGLVPPLIILQMPNGVAVTVCHNTEVFRDRDSSLCWSRSQQLRVPVCLTTEVFRDRYSSLCW